MKYSEILKRTKTQTRWWAYAAWTLPFVALAILVLENLVGFDTLIDKTVILIVVVFFSISVFWWWWALSKLVHIMDAMNSTSKNIKEVKDEIAETRKVLEKINN